MKKHLWTVEALIGDTWLTLAIEMSRSVARARKAGYLYQRTRIVKFVRA